MLETPKLNYAAPPPMHRRRVFRRVMYAVLSASLVASAIWWMPLVLRRVEILYWQRQCMIYVPPPGQVVYDPDHCISIMAKPWTRFYSLFSPPGCKSNGTIFLHELKQPNGERRLVALDLNLYVSLAGSSFPFVYSGASVAVLKPGDLTHQPQEVWCFTQKVVAGTQATKVFAGTVDPGDPSHFSFTVENGAERIIYDAWLENNNFVTISMRK